MSKIKSDDELEAEIPARAAKAAKSEYKRTLKAGVSVTISDGAALFTVSPDGTRKRIKSVPPRTRVTKRKFTAQPKRAKSKIA